MRCDNCGSRAAIAIIDGLLGLRCIGNPEAAWIESPCGARWIFKVEGNRIIPERIEVGR